MCSYEIISEMQHLRSHRRLIYGKEKKVLKKIIYRALPQARCSDCIQLQRRAPYTSATHSNKVQHNATHCNTLQHTATHCNTLQHTATHCNTLQRTAHSNKVQHNATHI